MKSQSKIINDQVFNLMDALRSPVLTHAQSWANAIPQRILEVITMARMANLIQNIEMATDPEVAAFIMTRTFEAPMSHEWVEIYTHICCKVCEQYFQENHWEIVLAPRELDEYTMGHYLNPLCKWIYEKRRKYLRERIKAETKITIPVINITKETEVIPNIVNGHYSLWDS